MAAIVFFVLVGAFVISVTDAIENYEPKDTTTFESKYYK